MNRAGEEWSALLLFWLLLLLPPWLPLLEEVSVFEEDASGVTVGVLRMGTGVLLMMPAAGLVVAAAPPPPLPGISDTDPLPPLPPLQHHMGVMW